MNGQSSTCPKKLGGMRRESWCHMMSAKILCWISHHWKMYHILRSTGQSANPKKCTSSVDGASNIQDHQQQSEATTVSFRVCRRHLHQEVVERISFGLTLSRFNTSWFFADWPFFMAKILFRFYFRNIPKSWSLKSLLSWVDPKTKHLPCKDSVLLRAKARKRECSRAKKQMTLMMSLWHYSLNKA